MSTYSSSLARSGWSTGRKVLFLTALGAAGLAGAAFLFYKWVCTGTLACVFVCDMNISYRCCTRVCSRFSLVEKYLGLLSARAAATFFEKEWLVPSLAYVK